MPAIARQTSCVLEPMLKQRLQVKDKANSRPATSPGLFLGAPLRGICFNRKDHPITHAFGILVGLNGQDAAVFFNDFPAY